jgi:hypothetical protein
MRISVSIKLDGISCIDTTPENCVIQHKATSVLCPLGKYPTLAYVLMLKRDLDTLDLNTTHELELKQATEVPGNPPTINYKTLSFTGLYILKYEKVGAGNVNYETAVYQVELGDKRALLQSASSDTGAIFANVRSFAKQQPYLQGTVNGLQNGNVSWNQLVKTLWQACGLPRDSGADPEIYLPPDLPIDGQPDTNIFVGVDAWSSLCCVLDYLDCAIRHNPFTNTYSIVQLGAAQIITEDTTLLKYDAKNFLNKAKYASTLNFYFPKKLPSGQEKDVELSNNWLLGNYYYTISRPTNIVTALGTKPVWQDLHAVYGENGNLSNSAALNTRATNKAQRYTARYSVPSQHKVFIGLIDNILPGGLVRAVFWRKSHNVTGTTTEYVTNPELASNYNYSENTWDFETETVSENFLAPDVARRTLPNYPRVVDTVQVFDTGYNPGDKIDPNPDGFFPGKVRRWISNQLQTLEDCWIRFVDLHDTKNGNVKATNNDIYGPGRLCGVSTSQGQTKPVYLARKGTEGSSGTTFVYFRALGFQNPTNRSVQVNYISHFPAENDPPQRDSDGNFTVFDPNNIYPGIHKDKKGVAVYNSGAQRWEILTVSERLVVFKLVQDKEPGLSAPAYICEWDGTGWTQTTETITVLDRYSFISNNTMWRAPQGAFGLAEATDQPGIYEIVYMQRVFPYVLFQAAQNRPYNSLYITATVLQSFGHGNLAVPVDGQGRFQVWDGSVMFPDVVNGSRGIAIYDEKENKYKAVVVEQVVIFAKVTLTGYLPSSYGSFIIADSPSYFTSIPFSLFNKEPPSFPIYALNPFNHKGGSSKQALLLRSEYNGGLAWIVVDVTKDLVEVITDIEILQNEHKIRLHKTQLAVEIQTALNQPYEYTEDLGPFPGDII